MKFGIKVVVMLSVLVAAVSLPSCKKSSSVVDGEMEYSGSGQEQDGVVRVKLRLPVERTITSKDGKSLQVSIVNRTATHITIVRAKDQKTFDLPIAKLSPEDQSFVKILPISKKVVKTVTDLRRENRQKEIARLREKVRELEGELSSGALNGSQSSMMKGKIKRLRQDIIKLGGKVQVMPAPTYEKKGSSRSFSS
ncbi:MAG: hypothetical protein L3J39_16940 [Verrucomicrobiales bacterium]|nr:hypothetical protein [Verrucomicrobiales bacterium]